MFQNINTEYAGFNGVIITWVIIKVVSPFQAMSLVIQNEWLHDNNTKPIKTTKQRTYWYF